MIRALPTAAPPRARRRFTPPWARARIVVAHPIRTELIHVRSEAEARALSSNPNVEILSVKTQPTGRWLVKVRYTDVKVSALPTRRLPFRLEGADSWARAMAVVTACLAVPVGGGWALWSAYGVAITSGLKTLAVVTVVLAVVTGLLWGKSKSGCAGLHCSGCSKH